MKSQPYELDIASYYTYMRKQLISVGKDPGYLASETFCPLLGLTRALLKGKGFYQLNECF